MPTLCLNPVTPGWPDDPGASGRRLRRFVGVSLLAHGLALFLKFQFWPLLPAQGAATAGLSGYDIQPISVRLAPAGRASENSASLPPPTSPPTSSPASGRSPPRAPGLPAGLMDIRPQPPESTAPRPDAQAMIELGKAEIAADSRRRMLDPMAAPAARPAIAAGPLERATAVRAQAVEPLAGQRVRVTTADGRRYCLQALPEIVTRDLPAPAIAVPTNCP